MFHATDCILIMGRRKCGKSFLSQNLQKLWPRKVIIDSLNEYTGEMVVHDFEGFAAELARLKAENKDSFTLIFQFDPENAVSDLEFEHVMRLCYYFGNIQVVIEEVQIYCSVHSMPHWLQQALLTGRHQNLSLMFTTQRPGELHKTILSQCAHIFCGQIIEGNDLRYLSSFLRKNTDELIKIPEREFLYFHNGQTIIIKNDAVSL